MFNRISIANAYFLWITTALIAWVILWFTGDLIELMIISAEGATSINSELSQNQLVVGLVIVSILSWLLVATILGLLVWLSTKTRKIWKYLLFFVTVLILVYEVYGNYIVWTSYDFSFGLYDYALSIISIIFLFVITFKSFVALRVNS